MNELCSSKGVVWDIVAWMEMCRVDRRVGLGNLGGNLSLTWLFRRSLPYRRQPLPLIIIIAIIIIIIIMFTISIDVICSSLFTWLCMLSLVLSGLPYGRQPLPPQRIGAAIVGTGLRARESYAPSILQNSGFGGSHLSDTTCLTHAFFKSDK